ncbi:MAG: PilZ domain-containing protein [Deltaproteobacteria bacterium]|nr:PilZ domain-containing protein [Myxococcales bacterium]TDJ11635.1 MAG: PilZ domain-containing protein [Deltaproteobacteria bacterium]TDJ20648.1 MAG: PilZ domain-containing protein [Deltaproteobacteria bacterium]
MESNKESDRRKYSRIATDQVISFAPVETRDLLAVSRDLSVGGIRFEAVGCEINFGDVLRVTFNVGDHTIVAVGKVVWATEMDPITTEVGIEFIEIDPAMLRLLEEAAGNPPSI